MSDIKIFVVHHKGLVSETIDNPLYVDIQGGAALTDIKLDMIGDDTGDNISEKNRSLNEMTVQYWAWKNVQADYYGICHYRRYLSFNVDEEFPTIEGGIISEQFISEEMINRYGLTEEIMRPIIEEYDILVANPIKMDEHPVGNYKTYYNNLKSKPQIHDMNDVDVFIDIVIEKYPEYEEYVRAGFGSLYANLCNCYIMKKEIWDEYNSLYFDVIFEYIKRIDTTNYSFNKGRAPGYMSEALFTIFYHKLINEKKYRIKTLQIVKIEYPEKQPVLLPAFSEKNIPVLFSSSNYYSDFLEVAIESIIENSTHENNYDIIIFENDISNSNKEYLMKMVKSIPNVSIRFYNPMKLMWQYKKRLSATLEKRIPYVVYFRLASPYILNNYDKVIWLDVDTITETDVAALLDVNLNGNIAAFTKDIWINSYANDAKDRTGKKNYIKSLPLKNIYDFVNTGVGVVDIKEFRDKYDFDEIMQEACDDKYKYREDALINVLLEGNLKFLDYRWNVAINRPRLDLASDSEYILYQAAREAPFIIHYNGGAKPWHNPNLDFADKFWYYARKTVKYEAIINEMLKSQLRKIDRKFNERNKKIEKANNKCTTQKSRIKRKIIMPIFKLIFPYGSKSYRKIKSIYFNLRKWDYNPSDDIL